MVWVVLRLPVPNGTDQLSKTWKVQLGSNGLELAERVAYSTQ